MLINNVILLFASLRMMPFGVEDFMPVYKCVHISYIYMYVCMYEIFHVLFASLELYFLTVLAYFFQDPLLSHKVNH